MHTSLLVVLLFSCLGHCLKCHKCRTTNIDFVECPDLREGAANTVFYDIGDVLKNTSLLKNKNANIKLPLLIPSTDSLHHCNDADACYVKESTYVSATQPWSLEAGCFEYQNPRFGDFLTRGFKRKNLVCDSTRKEGEFHRICYCNTDLCNYARSQGLTNNREILDYAKWYSESKNSVLHQSFNMIACLNLIVKLFM